MASETSEQDNSMLASSGPMASSAATTAGLSRVEKALAMIGGVETDSYVRNSHVQSTLADKIITPFYEKVLENAPPGRSPVVRVVDLGCSSGSNAIAQMSRIVQKLTGLYVNNSAPGTPPEFQAFFCDLPSNDFNTLFQLLTKDKEHNFFICGTPGSFYGRLYPRSSINVFYATICLHWLSKVPDAVLDKNSPAFNKGGWSLHEDSSPAARRALQEQAASDLKTFLHARLIELSPGGTLMFSVYGKVEDDTEDSQDLLDVSLNLLGQLWRELTKEGVISQEAADSFFLPMYTRRMEEFLEGIKPFSSAFLIHEAKMTKDESLHNLYRPSSSAEYANYWKAALGGILKDSIGDELSEVFWDRVRKAMESKIMPNLDKYKLKGANMYLLALTKKDNGDELRSILDS